MSGSGSVHGEIENALLGFGELKARHGAVALGLVRCPIGGNGHVVIVVTIVKNVNKHTAPSDVAIVHRCAVRGTRSRVRLVAHSQCLTGCMMLNVLGWYDVGHTTRCHFQSISNYSRRTGRFGLRTLGRQSEHGADNQCTQLFKWLVGLCPVPIVPGSAGKRCSRQYLYPFYTDLPTYDMLQRVVVDLRWLDPGLGRKAIQR